MSDQVAAARSLVLRVAPLRRVAIAAVACLAARAGARRRHARGDVERVFDPREDLLAVATLDGRSRHVNAACERILARTDEELTSRPFSDFVHPADRQRTIDAFARMSSGVAVGQFRSRYVRPDGSEVLLEWRTRAVPAASLVYAVAHAVTDCRRQGDPLNAARAELERSRDELRALADEQSALRRVATLVARGVAPTEVFDAVAEATRRVLNVDASALLRYEPDGSVTVMAQNAMLADVIDVGTRVSLDGDSAAARVLRTGKPSRMDSYARVPGPLAELQRRQGSRSSAGAPVIVEARVWGAIIATWARDRQMPADAETRLAEFTELIATAIANAESRAQLAASRARIVLAADETRRRIERNLHDATQQRLVAVTMAVRAVESRLGSEHPELAAELDRIARTLTDALDELQEIARGLHPAILSRHGLAAALKALARRSPIPVELSLDLPQRLTESLETAAFYIVSEALTNAAKHSTASFVNVHAAIRNGQLALTVRDDGVGGANPTRGSGLIGLRDRVEALDGTLAVLSPPGEGTLLTVRLPIPQDSPAAMAG